jgi:type IV fimbrial biogenesis protein FimT
MSRHGRVEKLTRAFTVLELMIVIAVAGVLLAAGIPALQSFTQKQRMKAAVATLQNDLLTARSEAVHRNQSVVACPGEPLAGCIGITDWSAGWIVFSDRNRDRQRQHSEPMVRHGQGFHNLNIFSSQGRTEVRFYPDGSAPGSNSSISFCGPGGPAEARKLVISNLGRIRRDLIPNLNPAFCPG